MARLALVLALAACEIPQQPLDEPPPPPPADAGVDADAAPVIAMPLPIARPYLAVSAMHGAPLRALAVSEDGTVAVSADRHGSLRFWPRLDGKREPVVVAAHAASALAIVHDGDGVSFAALDEVGQVEIVQLGALGQPHARTAVELARPVVEIRAIDHGFLARRDDGAIVRIAANGTRGRELRPGARQHVTALAVRRGAALAIVDSGGEIRGRWIDVATMRWGKQTEVFDIDGAHVELSPGHNRLAAVAHGGKELVVLDVAMGTLVYSPVAADFVDPLLRPIGFQTDDALVISRGGSIAWRTELYLDRDAPAFASGEGAVSDAGAVAEADGGFVLDDADARDPEYLGYQLASPSRLHALAGGGWLATDGRNVAAIDSHLHTSHAYDLAEVAGFQYGFTDVRFVDDRHVIAVGYARPSQQIYLFALDTQIGTPVADCDGLIDYDAERGVIAYRRKDEIAFARYDSKTGTFGAEAAIHVPGNSAFMRFLEPGNADVAVVVDASYAYDAASTATITRVHAVRADGTLALGKVRSVELSRNWWRTNGNTEKLAGVEAAAPAWTHASPDGKLVAELSNGRVTVRDARGTVRWSAGAPDAFDIMWGKDGALVARGQGMARFDAATGDVIAVQCGWRFGRGKQVLPGGATATMCEQSWTAAE